MTENKRAIFNEFAYEYFLYRPYLPTAIGEQLIDITRLSQSSRLLEVGCGTGQATKSLSSFPFDIVAIDIGEDLIRYAKRNDYGQLNTSFACISFEDYENSGLPFDLVFSSMAFHWINPAVAYSKAAALLKDNGFLALINVKRDYPEKLSIDLDAVYAKFSELRGKRPSLQIESNESHSEREQFFRSFSSYEQNFELSYSAESYVGLMKTMSPQRSLSSDLQKEYYHQIGEVFTKHGTISIRNIVSTKIFQKL